MASKKHPREQESEIPDTPADDVSAAGNPGIEAEDAEDENPVGSEAAQSEIETLQGKLAEAQDKHLRLAAEFDNYRKRTLREKTELIQTAGESLLKNILPVVDDLDRGLEMIGKSDDMESVKTGMELIHAKLRDFLAASGVREINAMNELFDADRHEAVTNIPAPSEEMKGKVVDVIQKGYTLNDKIIRYPKVVVGE